MMTLKVNFKLRPHCYPSAPLHPHPPLTPHPQSHQRAIIIQTLKPQLALRQRVLGFCILAQFVFGRAGDFLITSKISSTEFLRIHLGAPMSANEGDGHGPVYQLIELGQDYNNVVRAL